MKYLFYCALCAFVLINLKCATFIYGPKEIVDISTTKQGVELKLDNKEAITLPTEISLSKKKQTHIIEVSKPGFETQSFQFTRNARPIKALATTGLVLGGATVIGGGLTGLLINSAGLSGSSGSGVTIGFVAVGGALMIPGIIDGASKSAYTFTHKALEFDMIPNPIEVVIDSMETIGCTSVNFKISPGTTLGSIYEARKGNFEKIKSIEWEETSNISVEELEVQVNNDLNTYYYTVPGMDDKFKKQTNPARFLLTAEITELDYSRYNYVPQLLQVSQSAPYDATCKMDVKWKVYDNKKKVVVYETRSSTLVINNNQSFKVLIFKSLTGSLKKLLANEAFVDEIRKKNNEGILNTATTSSEFESINIGVIKPVSKLSEVIESAITIDLGDGHGSGFIISNDGYAITNYHVVDGHKEVTVILSNGINLNADVIRTDSETDVALIKISGKGFKPSAISLNETSIGSNIIAVGTPGRKELGQTISKGIISGKREFESGVFLQTDVNISPGSSGGPVFNEQNEVIGIITSKLIGQGIEGIGFAIPINIAIEKLGIKLK